MSDEKIIDNQTGDKPLGTGEHDTISSDQEPVNQNPPTGITEPVTIESPAEKIATENPHLSTQQEMEVHHHTHATHGRKTWKQYFWEFFMLFLAVFCGFLAEYQLEHTIEHHREKQYIESMISDLKSDQQLLSHHINMLTNSTLMMDTLSGILNNPAEIGNSTGELYYLARLAPRLQPLSNNNRTFEQLKNSGNFRLIRKLEASNRIMVYYEKFPLVRLLESINDNEFTQYKSVAAKVLDPAVLIRMEGANGTIIRTSENPPLRTTDKELLQELSVFAVYMNGTKKGILDADVELKKSGEELIAYLQKEYHLENE